jgi:hypothetical protein
LVRKKKYKQTKSKLPTLDEFLAYVPKRAEFEWSINQEGLVQIKVPKFKGKFGTSFVKLIKKSDTFSANLDKIGSTVWKNCDGKNTIKDILEIMKAEFSGEDDIDQRLFLFLRQMQSLNYLSF